MSDQQTNLLLVAEVEQRPILYNFHLPDYSKKFETDKAWEEVGNVVKLTAAECKERWRNIRAVFVRHMKRCRDGLDTRGKKTYYLFDAMQFTVPYIKSLWKHPQPPQLVEEELLEGDVNIKIEEDDLQLYTSSPSPPPLTNPSSNSSSSTAGLPRRQDHQFEPTSDYTPKRKRTEENGDVDQSFAEFSGCKKATSLTKDDTFAADSKAEALKMFLHSMMPDLMKMDDRELRQFKRKTLEVVDDILSEKSTPCSSEAIND